MHNLPIDEDDVRERNDCAYTLRCFDRFVALQPELADRFDLVDLLRQIRRLLILKNYCAKPMHRIPD